MIKQCSDNNRDNDLDHGYENDYDPTSYHKRGRDVVVRIAMS